MTVVLIVEDEPAILSMLSDFLKDEGFEVLSVSDGYAAISILGREPIDVVLADIGLPGALGTSIVARALKRNPAPAVVLMSGYSYNMPDSMKDHGIPVLQKPVELDLLVGTIRARIEATKTAP